MAHGPDVIPQLLKNRSVIPIQRKVYKNVLKQNQKNKKKKGITRTAYKKGENKKEQKRIVKISLVDI